MDAKSSNLMADFDLKVRIFDALDRLTVSKSFDKISVTQICTEAGVSRATFYRHFSDKFSIPQWYLDFAWAHGVHGGRDHLHGYHARPRGEAEQRIAPHRPRDLLLRARLRLGALALARLATTQARPVWLIWAFFSSWLIPSPLSLFSSRRARRPCSRPRVDGSTIGSGKALRTSQRRGTVSFARQRAQTVSRSALFRQTDCFRRRTYYFEQKRAEGDVVALRSSAPTRHPHMREAGV